MAGKPGIRLPIAPLDRELAANNIDVEFIEGKLNGSIRQARVRGYLTLAVADEAACSILKMHPIEIWGDAYAEVVWHDGDDLQDTDLEHDIAEQVAA